MEQDNQLLGSGVEAPSSSDGQPSDGGANLLTAPTAPNPQQLLAPVLASATDPGTGEVNYNKAFVGLASSPQTSSLASGFLDQAVQRGVTNLPTALKELETAYTKQKLIGSAAKALLPLGVNVSQAELISAISSPEFSRAIPDPRMRAQILASAPKGGQMLANWVAANAAQSESAAGSIESVLHSIHAKLADEILARKSPDVHALVNAPGWIGKAAQKYLARNPQVLDGPRSGERVNALVSQLGALKKQENVAQQHYSTLAPPGSPPFDQWWESSLAKQGIV